MACLAEQNFALFLVALLNGILLLSIVLSIDNASRVVAKQSNGHYVYHKVPNHVQPPCEFNVMAPSIIYRHPKVTFQDLVNISAALETTQGKEWTSGHKGTDFSTSGERVRRLDIDTFMINELSGLLKEHTMVSKLACSCFNSDTFSRREGPGEVRKQFVVGNQSWEYLIKFDTLSGSNSRVLITSNSPLGAGSRLGEGKMEVLTDYFRNS